MNNLKSQKMGRSRKMNPSSVERFTVNIPPHANARLDELRAIADPPLNKGQMAALAIKEKWERDIGAMETSAKESVNDNTNAAAVRLLEKFAGNKEKAIEFLKSKSLYSKDSWDIIAKAIMEAKK
jgi:hypothetical protein